MTGNYFGQAGTFLIDTFFVLYIGAVLVRFLLQVVRADFYNPISQFVVAITNPPLLLLRRIIPGLWGIDVASLVLMLALMLLKNYLLGIIQGAVLAPLGAFVLAIADLLSLTIGLFILILVVRAVVSWVAPQTYNPAVSLLVSLSEPIVRPARRLLPPVAGIDLSFLVVLVGLYLARILLVQPIWDIGRALAN